MSWCNLAGVTRKPATSIPLWFQPEVAFTEDFPSLTELFLPVMEKSGNRPSFMAYYH